MVAAAGNGGKIGLNFPAVLPSVISVGSSNWLDRRSEFSSFAGPGQVLDVIAPGELIWSTAVVSAYDALLYEMLGLPGSSRGPRPTRPPMARRSPPRSCRATSG